MLSWNDLIGRRLGQYEIVAELGRGGSSRVYRAHAPELGYDAAIKVIPNDAEDRVGFVQRFIREVEVIRKLSHPNIVRVYDSGETDEIVYLVLQCVMGGTLRQRLGGRPLPAPQAAAYVIQMARALHHAHLQGIVHRDVKPSNMLVDADDINHLLLTDFGTAKIQGARGLTKSGTTIGTPEYMSPEQAEGREIDQRADIYALGCVLYEALATRPPFIGSTPVSVLYQQVHSRPASIRSYNPTVSRDLARVVEIALAKRPSDRFGTAEQLAEALTPFAAEVIQPAAAPWMAGANLGMTPSAPLSGRLEPSPGMRAPRTAPIPAASPLSSLSPNALPPTPPTLPATGPFAPTASAPANDLPIAGSPSLPTWLGAPQMGASAGATAATFANNSPASEEVLSSSDVPTADAEPSTRRPVRPSIPLPSFRLPARGTDPNGQTMTQMEREEIARMLAQVEQAELAKQAQSAAPPPELPTIPAHTPDAALESFVTRETDPQAPIPASGAALDAEQVTPPIKGRKATLASAPGLADVLATRGKTPTAQSPAYPFAEPSPLEQDLDADLLAPPTLTETPAMPARPMGERVGASRGVSWPDMKDDGEYPDGRYSDGGLPHDEIETAPTAIVHSGRHVGVKGRGRAVQARRSWLIGGVAAALLALAVVSYLALGASGLGALAGHGSGPHAQATATTRPQPTATPTLNPTPTLTATPAGTATPNSQQVLDQEAANSFRAVTLASFVDGSCSAGNSQNHFSLGERVYVNLCTGDNPANGPMTIQIRQNGVVIYTLVYGQYLSANGSYWYYHSLGSGNYDALVTITLNGYQAVARDLYFSVG